MEVGSAFGTGVRVVAFAALHSSDRLNRLVNWCTRGSINRDTLAQKVLHDTVSLGLASKLKSQGLGERTAAIVPLANKILFDKSADALSASIKQLTHEIVRGGADDAPGFMAAGKKLATEALASTLAATFKETQFTEKLLATMARQPDGLQPLKAFMEKSLSGVPFKGFVSNLVTNLLQRDVASQPALDQSERPVFRLMAAQANAFLTNGDQRQPLKDYFTDSAKAALPDAAAATVHGVVQVASELAQTVVKASEVLIDGYVDVKDSLAQQQYAEAAGKAASAVYHATAAVAEGVVTGALPALVSTAAALTGITINAAIGTVIVLAPTVQAATTSLYQGALAEAGRLYDMAAGPPAYRNGFEAYTKDIEQALQQDALPALPLPDARTSDSQWADALARQHSMVQFAMPGAAQTLAQHTAPLDQALEQGQIDAGRKDALVDLTDKFSTAQLAPFGLPGASQQAAHNTVSGQLARFSAESQAQLPLAQGTTETMASALDATSSKTSDRAGYKLADTYAAQVGQLDLDFPEGVYSYADASKDQLSGASNLWWGENITLADRAELRKLYNTCGGSEQQTLAVSRYLDPDMAASALEAPVMAALDPKGTGLLQLGEPTGLQLQLADSTPAYRYQLRREGENVQVTLSATWDIAQYGTDAGQLRSPQGAQDNQLTSSVTITVPTTGPARHEAPTLQCAIRNEFQFGPHGQLEVPTEPV